MVSFLGASLRLKSFDVKFACRLPLRTGWSTYSSVLFFPCASAVSSEHVLATGCAARHERSDDVIVASPIAYRFWAVGGTWTPLIEISTQPCYAVINLWRVRTPVSAGPQNVPRLGQSPLATLSHRPTQPRQPSGARQPRSSS
eukprot:SAG11_NODE_3397_length_2471_cov_2.713744_2_plen_143_part_00